MKTSVSLISSSFDSSVLLFSVMTLLMELHGNTACFVHCSSTTFFFLSCDTIDFSYPFGIGIFVKMLRPLQVGAVKATDGECKRKADEVKRREGEIADGEAGASHSAGFSLLGDLRFWVIKLRNRGLNPSKGEGERKAGRGPSELGPTGCFDSLTFHKKQSLGKVFDGAAVIVSLQPRISQEGVSAENQIAGRSVLLQPQLITK